MIFGLDGVEVGLRCVVRAVDIHEVEIEKGRMIGAIFGPKPSETGVEQR